jgi:membrane protease YdiL (CAAX protease family)
VNVIHAPRQLSSLSLLLRSGVAALACIGIWKAGLSLLPEGASSAQRLLAGCVISTLVLAFVVSALRWDRLGPSVLGLARMGDVLRGAIVGAGLWLLTALPVTALLLWLGVAEVRIDGDWYAALATLLILIPAVLLIEAIPEELVFRGYLQGQAARRLSPWVSVFLQATFFLLFAWAIGATDASGQWSFLPGFAVILGGLRLMGGNLGWPIGFHAALMIATQWLLAHGHFMVHNAMVIQVIAFVALPSAVYGVALSIRNAGKAERKPQEAAPLG